MMPSAFRVGLRSAAAPSTSARRGLDRQHPDREQRHIDGLGHAHGERIDELDRRDDVGDGTTNADGGLTMGADGTSDEEFLDERTLNNAGAATLA